MNSSPPAEPAAETSAEPQETTEISTEEILVDTQVESTAAEDAFEQQTEPEPKRDVIIEEYDSSQRQVNDLIASLRMDLLTSRSEVASLKGKVNSLTAQNIDLTIKNQGVTSSETVHKLQMEQMEARLNDLKQKESEYRRQLLETDNERNLLKDLKQKQHHEHISETSTLKHERDELTQKNSDLRLEVAKGRTEIDVIKAEKKALQLRNDELELGRMGASKAHEDLIAIYEKQQKDAENQLDHAIAAEARARQDAKSIEEQLRKENDDLQQKLVECQDRLSIVRSHNDGSPQPFGSAPGGKHSNLIQLMREYEKGGKKWEYIYEDYFELRDAHIKTVSQCENMRGNIEKLMRQQRDKEQRYHRMETELARVQADTEAIRERARQSEAAQSENDKIVNGLKSQINELQLKNNELKQSLHDAAYQLRYMIRDVELRNEILPPEVQSSSDLLNYASLTPEFTHDDLVFKNVAELQQQNQALLQRIRKLNEEVIEKADTAEQLRKDSQDVEEKYTQAIRQAQETITDLNHSVSSLERRLSTAIKQRDMYKLGLSDEASSQQPSVPDTTQPNSDPGDDEDEAYRYAMQQDMQQLQAELQEAQSAVSVSNGQLKYTEAEIDNLRRECQSLLAVQASRATEIKELRTRNIELEQLLGNNEQRYAQRNQDIVSSREKENVLRTENTTLRAQLDFSDTLHKNALQENESLSSQCAQLTSLIKTMTKADTSPIESFDFLKKQIEAQDRELEGLRLKLENAQQRIGESQGLEQDHWKNKYSEVHRELENLNATQLELQKELAAAKEQRIGLETKLALLEKKEEDKQEEEQDTTFEKRYTEVAAANMEVDKLRIQITDYQDQLDKQRQAAAELEREHDAFTSDMQAKLAKVHQDLSDRDGMIKAAQTATDDIQRLKLERAEAEQQWNIAKDALNVEKTALQQRVEEYEEEASRLRQQIETQAEMINESKHKLEQEISSHANDAETIKHLQEDSTRLNEEYASAKAELGTLQTQIQTSEESWAKQKEQWEAAEARMKAELENSNQRFSELFENLPRESNVPATIADKTEEQLKELAVQLGKKNEIIEQQYKVAVTQADQLRSDLGFCQKQVATLHAQVKTIQVQNEEIEKKYAVAQQEAKNEAVVYKENNTQLRATISDIRNKLSVAEKEATENKDAIQPLSNKIVTLESKVKAQTETIASLEKSKQEWSTRTAEIMSKYNKLDPAEVESVKQERDALKAQLENIDTTKSDSDVKLKEVEEQKTKIEKELEDLKQRVPKLQNAAAAFKKRWEQAQEKAKAEGTSVDNTKLDEEKKALEEKLKEVTEEKDKVEASLKQRVTAHQELQKKHQSLLARSRQIIGDKAKIVEEHKLCEEKLKNLEIQLNEQKEQNAKAQEELKTCISEKKVLETEQARTKVKLSVDSNKIAKLNKELESLKRARNEEDSQEGAPATKVQKQDAAE